MVYYFKFILILCVASSCTNLVNNRVPSSQDNNCTDNTKLFLNESSRIQPITKEVKERRIDHNQREIIEQIDEKLGDEKDFLIAKYFHGDKKYLTRTDQIYLAGMAQIVEGRIRRKQLGIANKLMPNMMERQTQRYIDRMLNKCNQRMR